MKPGDIRVPRGPKDLALLALMEGSARRMHAQLGLPDPGAWHEHGMLVGAGEQFGVELRPASLYKLLILNGLARQGHRAVFLLESRDVGSKDKRLRGWGLPDPDSREEALIRRISPVEKSVSKKTDWGAVALGGAFLVARMLRVVGHGWACGLPTGAADGIGESGSSSWPGLQLGGGRSRRLTMRSEYPHLHLRP